MNDKQLAQGAKSLVSDYSKLWTEAFASPDGVPKIKSESMKTQIMGMMYGGIFEEGYNFENSYCIMQILLDGEAFKAAIRPGIDFISLQPDATSFARLHVEGDTLDFDIINPFIYTPTEKKLVPLDKVMKSDGALTGYMSCSNLEANTSGTGSRSKYVVSMQHLTIDDIAKIFGKHFSVTGLQ